jgi:3-hydroxyacyl-[acyl-carrier-protein] dehydratase
MKIEQKLHHRPPYLLLQEVHSHSSSELVASSTFSGDEFFLQGHFPGTPVVPGAMMQEMTTQAAGLLLTLYHSPVPDYDSEKTKGWALGVLRAVHGARYKSFARPGEELKISVTLIDQVESSFRFVGKIMSQDKKIMTNEFTLVNISEEQLKGLS